MKQTLNENSNTQLYTTFVVSFDYGYGSMYGKSYGSGIPVFYSLNLSCRPRHYADRGKQQKS